MSNELFPRLDIQLVGTTETNWVMEGTEKTERPQRMNWAGLYRIAPVSKYREPIPAEQGGGYRLIPIRYIAGCDFIDPKRQALEGFVHNLEQDNIWVQNGNMSVLHEGADIGKYEYLKLYEGNTSNEKRPPDAGDEFREIIASQVAASNNLGFDQKAEAYAILREIRQPNDQGGYIYNSEKLALMATLFDLNHLDTPEEKFQELYSICEEKPGLIVNSILNGKKKLLAVVKKAEDLSVISLSQEGVTLTETGTMVLEFKGKPSKQVQVDKLSEFLLTDEGKPFFQQIIQSTETATDKSLARATAKQF